MSGGYRPADGLGVVEQGSAVYLAPLPDGPIMVLDGISGAIWVAACTGPAETIADRAADTTATTADEIRATAEAFVAELVRRGLLTEQAFDEASDEDGRVSRRRSERGD